MREWAMRWGLVAGGVVIAGAAIIGLRLLTHRGAEQGLDLAIEGLPPGFTATHGPVTFNPVTGTAHLEHLVVMRDGALFASVGIVEASGIGSVVGGMPVRIGHVTLRDVAGNGQYRHFDRIEVDGLETRNLRDLFDPASYPGGKPAWTNQRPMVASLDAYGVVMHVDPEAQQQAKHINLKPFDITAKHSHNDQISARQFAAGPSFAHMLPADIAAVVLQAMASRGGGAEGVEAVIPEAGIFSVGAMTTHGYDGGKLDDVQADQIAFVSAKENGRATLDHMRIAGIDVTRTLALVPAAMANPDSAAATLNGTTRIGRFTTSGFKADFAAAPLITIDSIEAHTNYPNDTISSSTAGLHGLNIVTTGRALPDKDMEQLRQFGMADFTADVDLAGSFDRTTGHVVLTREDLMLKGLGTLHIAFDLDGVKFDSNTPAAMQQSMGGVRINSADIHWNDASLTSRLFKLAAARSGQSEDALRSTLSLSLIGLAAYLPDQPDAADQVNAFLDGRHSLDITIAPSTPVTVADLTAAGTTEKPHLLGVRIKGN
jgi:hypothetical protein